MEVRSRRLMDWRSSRSRPEMFYKRSLKNFTKFTGNNTRVGVSFLINFADFRRQAFLFYLKKKKARAQVFSCEC